MLIKKLLRPLFYLFNNGKIVNINYYKHLNGFKWIADKNYGMAYYKGYYEPELCQYLLKNINENSVFIDVGAHAGYFSLFTAVIAKMGEVVSFEPNVQNIHFMKSIKNLNGISNWQIIEKAVGSEITKLSFSKGLTSSTGKISAVGEYEIDVTCLDIELSNINRIDIIKIDVEGFGGRVIEGSINIIKKFKPKIMIEIHEGSDELNIVMDKLLPIYELRHLESGEEITNINDKVHFIIAEPK